MELEKLKRVGIIFSITHLEWLSSPMVVINKNGEICLCVEFCDLNRARVKHNYPLPNMEMLLQQVNGYSLMSILDEFSGYNCVLVAEEDRSKIYFITPSRTYAYVLMPFSLKSASATFESAMDHAFRDLIGKFMVDYQDELTIHSILREFHLKHLS
jgi:hypothetical protein